MQADHSAAAGGGRGGEFNGVTGLQRNPSAAVQLFHGNQLHRRRTIPHFIE
jgi:hypothetical protein